MKVQKSDTYSVFQTIKGNRGIKKSHVSRLKEAIAKDAESTKYTPILVNEKMEVIDGQHRLMALQELDLPVHYLQVEGLGLEDVQRLNSLSKTWTPVDYARSYAEKGKKDYQTYLYFKRDFHLNHDVLLKYLGLDNPITSQMFKDGKMKISNAKASHDLCSKLVDFSEFYKGYTKRSFALAFKKFWANPNYDHKFFIEKLRSRGPKIQDRSLPEDYIRDLMALYNSHLRDDSMRIFIQ